MTEDEIIQYLIRRDRQIESRERRRIREQPPPPAPCPICGDVHPRTVVFFDDRKDKP